MCTEVKEIEKSLSTGNKLVRFLKPENKLKLYYDTPCPGSIMLL